MTGSVLVVEHEADAGLSLMAQALAGHVHVVRPYRGERLPEPGADLARFGGLLVLGGAMGAGDDEVAPWLPLTRALLADAVRTQLPTLGICLGGQLLAVACGGTAEPGTPGLEIGVVPVTPLTAAAADPFFGRVQQALAVGDDGGPGGGAASSWLVRQYHFDAVTRLPADAELIVTGNPYPHQGFRVGAQAWGVQYHPEVSTELFTDWVFGGLRKGELPEGSVDVLAPVQATSPAQSVLAAAHARAFLDVVTAATVSHRS